MTVQELIDALKKCDPAMEVATDGCDCHGDVGEIVEYSYGDGKAVVLLLRPEHMDKTEGT